MTPPLVAIASDRPMGELLHLPLQKRSCVQCKHFDTPEDEKGLLSSHCTQWNEPLDDETVAAECPDFDRDEDQT
jgi:hypothetical protein